MAIVCLAFFVGDAITSQAAECTHEGCNETIIQHGENLSHWTVTREVTLRNGMTAKCIEGISLDRTYYTCPVHGTWSEDIATIMSHSIDHL